MQTPAKRLNWTVRATAVGLLCSGLVMAGVAMAQESPAQVPQGIVDRAESHQIVAAPRMAVGSVDAIPKRLVGHGILIDQVSFQRAIDYDRRVAVDRPVEAFDANIGANF